MAFSLHAKASGAPTVISLRRPLGEQ